MEAGVIAGYPLVKVKVTLYDGSYHDVDSSEVAFKVEFVALGSILAVDRVQEVGSIVEYGCGPKTFTQSP